MIRRLLDILPTALRVGFADALAYRSEFIVWILSTNTPLIMMVLWTAVASEAPVGRFGEREFTAYFLTTLIVRLLTGVWVAWEINMEARSGELAMRLVKPVHPFITYATANLGAWPIRVAACTPVFGVALYLAGSAYSHDARQLVLVPVAILGAWLLNFSAMLTVGSIALRFHSSRSIFEVWLGMYFVLSGYLVPLELFPPVVRQINDFLPFRFLLSVPVETALGLVSFTRSLELVVAQWTYALAFLLLALFIWARGLRRYEAFGG